MDWKRKLTSRKFWLTIVNFCTQLLIFAKVPENEIAQVAAVIMAAAGVIAFVIGEGLADAAGAAAPVEIEDEDDPFADDLKD